MNGTIEQAVAELLRDGDPARGIPGLQALFGFDLYDAPTASDRRIFVGETPPQPDEMVTVLRDVGLAPVEGSYGQGIGRRPTLTVATRAPGYERSSEIADAARQILDEYEGTKADVPIARMNANAEIVPLGRDREDKGGRWLQSQSFRAITKRYSFS